MNNVQYKFSPAGVQRLPGGVFIPEDIGNKDWLAYLSWVDEGGKTLPLLNAEEEANAERRWRDAELDAVKWLRERHRDEVELGGSTSLTADQFSELLVYMQALRDWPQSTKFPTQKYRPKKPGWIDQQTV
ncbi:phage tail assembly chaperone [Pseudomonas yamanorum]|uniref:Phage tail assembly chaperone n=1 Tax=Pseudomonas yamanorum TaxID=515393 RepID=A0ABU1CR70_9PSED|nr:phage tail assembly chaperone [Pseudomonas yamanorum]MDR0189766.1 phage tail assembly chaperone [Pseudomonas yamanorum]